MASTEAKDDNKTKTNDGSAQLKNKRKRLTEPDAVEIDSIIQSEDLIRQLSNDGILEINAGADSIHEADVGNAAEAVARMVGNVFSQNPNPTVNIQLSRTLETTTGPSSIPTLPARVQPSPTPKKHIMISYNRSCYDQCDQIRRYLESRNYIVWMDMTRLRGNFIDSIAQAIGNSYIALLCINRAYPHSYWCKREAQFLAKKQIECIPCYMENPFQLDDWLEFIVGANNVVDFSSVDSFEDKMQILLREITHHEEKLLMNPRRSLPTSPSEDFPSDLPPNSTSLTRGEFDHIIRTFKLWVETNRELLRRTDQSQAQQLVEKLTKSLREDENFDRQTKDEFLENLSNLIDGSTRSEQNSGGLTNVIRMDTMIQGLIYFLLSWALQVIFKP